MEVKDFIPIDHDDPYMLSGKVAVVGNSANILDSNKGSFIDGFDRVFRFNHAVTKGYEKDVGSKTTDVLLNMHFYAMNDKRKALMSKTYEKFSTDVLHEYVNVNAILTIQTKERGYIPKNLKLYSLGKKAMREVNHLPYEISKQPTSGYAMVAALVNLGVVPHLFGFSLASDRWDYKNTHYFEQRKASGRVHNHQEERELLQKMIDEGKAIKG